MAKTNDSSTAILLPNNSSFQPTCIQAIRTPRGTANHSYHDFCNMPIPEDYKHPLAIKDMTFSQKIHHILSNPETERWISWMPHGRAFRVLVPVTFENEVCPRYFGHKRYSSFLRDLNNYGFKHITKGIDRNCYYHELMLKGRPHLCQYMPKRKDARRQVADPANEPNFYRISDRFPLNETSPESTKNSVEKKPKARVLPPSTYSNPLPADSEGSKLPATAYSTVPIIGQPAVATVCNHSMINPVAQVVGRPSQTLPSMDALPLLNALVAAQQAQSMAVAPVQAPPVADLMTVVNALLQTQKTQAQDTLTAFTSHLEPNNNQDIYATMIALTMGLNGE